MTFSIRTADSLDPSARADVITLATRLESRFGAPPLNDHTLAQLGASDTGLVHLTAYDGPLLVGYAQVERGATAAVEVAADAAAAALLDAAEQISGGAAISVWAHGRRSPVTPAAEERGFERVRELWQLRRPLTDLPAAAVPEGVTIRPFVPGQDEDAWLAVNAAAFAHHAEQGRWTRRDVDAREVEAWFDPAGFLLAVRGDELLGYHWTKVHDRPPPIGEVYVLGIAPAAQGMRLGQALLVAGLSHLASRGLSDVLLYVDGSNTVALALYEKFGFTRHDLDVQLRRN